MILLAFCVSVLAEDFIVTEAEYVVISGNPSDTLGRTRLTPDSIRIVVSDSAQTELFDAWFEDADDQATLNGDVITFSDQWEDINGAASVGVFSIMVTIASDAQNDIDLFSNYNYTLRGVTAGVEQTFNDLAIIKDTTQGSKDLLDDRENWTLAGRDAIGDTIQRAASVLVVTDNIGVNFNDITGTLSDAEVELITVTVAAMSANVITSSQLGTACIGSDELSVTGIREIADGVWDQLSPRGVVEDSTGNNTTRVQTNLAEATDNHYNGQLVLFMTGTEESEARLITDYDGTNGWILFTPALTGTPGTGDSLRILPWGGVNVASVDDDALNLETDVTAVLPDSNLSTWDAILTGATHNIATSSGKLLRELAGLGALAEGEAQGGGATYIILAAATSRADDFFNENMITIIGGTGDGQSKHIEDFTGATDSITLYVGDDWFVNPDATSEYQILPAAATHVASIHPAAVTQIVEADTVAMLLMLINNYFARLDTDTSINVDAGGHPIASPVNADGDTLARFGDSSAFQGSASGLTKEEIADAVGDTLEAGTRQINYRSFTVDSGTVFAASATGVGFTMSGGATSGDAAYFHALGSSSYAAYFQGGPTGEGHAIVAQGRGATGSGFWTKSDNRSGFEIIAGASSTSPAFWVDHLSATGVDWRLGASGRGYFDAAVIPDDTLQDGELVAFMPDDWAAADSTGYQGSAAGLDSMAAYGALEQLMADSQGVWVTIPTDTTESGYAVSSQGFGPDALVLYFNDTSGTDTPIGDVFFSIQNSVGTPIMAFASETATGTRTVHLSDGSYTVVPRKTGYIFESYALTASGNDDSVEVAGYGWAVDAPGAPNLCNVNGILENSRGEAYVGAVVEAIRVRGQVGIDTTSSTVIVGVTPVSILADSIGVFQLQLRRTADYADPDKGYYDITGTFGGEKLFEVKRFYVPDQDAVNIGDTILARGN